MAHSEQRGDEAPVEWIEVAERDALRLLGIDGVGAEPTRILGLLLTEPSTRRFLNVAPARAGDEEAALGYLVGRTRIFVKKGELTNLRADVLAGLAVWVLSQSLTWSAAIGLFQKLVRSVSRLDQTEVEVLRIVLEFAEGDRPVATDAIVERYGGERSELDRHLGALSRQGVLWSEGGGWRVAP